MIKVILKWQAENLTVNLYILFINYRNNRVQVLVQPTCGLNYLKVGYIFVDSSCMKCAFILHVKEKVLKN